MVQTFKADTATNHVAVYRGTDHTVFDDPGANADQFDFSSKFKYPDVVSESTVSLTLAASSVRQQISQTRTLMAHGQTGQPLVEGILRKFEGSTVNIPLKGSVPLFFSTTGQARYIILGADSTNVVLHDYATPLENFSWPAWSIEIDLYISTFDLASTPVGPHPNESYYFDADEFRADEGRFDISRKYWRKNTASTLTTMAGGQTIETSYPSGVSFKYDGGDYEAARTEIYSGIWNGAPYNVWTVGGVTSVNALGSWQSDVTDVSL